jgi:hypothetical protein
MEFLRVLFSGAANQESAADAPAGNSERIEAVELVGGES